VLHRLHQHEANVVFALGAATDQLEILYSQALVAVGRRDDAPVERDRILLLLDLGLKIGETRLDLGIRFAVDIPMRFE
jgi:hypothetical protein